MMSQTGNPSEGKRDVFHCILKHLTNARVHVQEAASDVSEQHYVFLLRVWQRIDYLVRQLQTYYSGSDIDVFAFRDMLVYLRRVLQSFIENESSNLKRVVWLELSFAVGHLDNAYEHLMELSLDSSSS